MATAYAANYIRSLKIHQVEELIEIGAEIGVNYKYNHCPKCVLDFVKKLAGKYYEQKKKMEENRNASKNKETKG